LAKVSLDAFSEKDIELIDPNFKAFEEKPDWMSQTEKEKYVSSCESKGFHWDIDEKPTGWLAQLLLAKGSK